jgi:hypothetical protein
MPVVGLVRGKSFRGGSRRVLVAPVTVFACLVLFFGALPLLAGMVRLLSLLRSGGLPQAMGSVVRLEEDPRPEFSHWIAIVRFEVRGETFEARSAISSSTPLYRVGQAVGVRYNSSDPKRNEVVSGREWATAWLVFLGGVVLMALGTLLLLHRE